MPTPLACAFYGVPEDFNAMLKSQLKKPLSIRIHPEPAHDGNIDPKTNILGVFVESKITQATFHTAKHLKLIATMSTGFDHIDLAAAKKHGVIVSNVPAYGTTTVAEHALALMLALSRKIVELVKNVREGHYDFGGLRGFDIAGKTIGIIGGGHIGLHLAELLRGFGVTILVSDPTRRAELAKQYNFTYATVEAIYKKADIISLHAPLMKETYHLINTAAFAKMKKGVYIINTARGGLIDPEALCVALDKGIVAGAGLDVLEHEEAMQDPESLLYSENKDAAMRTAFLNHMLVNHPSVIITPHNAFNSTEAIGRIVQTTIDNIKAFAKGKPANVVKGV